MKKAETDENVHTHNLKTTLILNENSMITWLSPVIKNNFIHIKEYRQILKNVQLRFLWMFVKSYACCFPTYFALDSTFDPLSMLFPP